MMGADDSNRRSGTPGEVFTAFLRLGLTCFGGPIAHLGYFSSEFVLRRQWIDEAGYAELVALCQFLPGPASSQTGFLLGWRRAGAFGALAAWTGFTLPSALVMLALGFGVTHLDGPIAIHAIHGLKLVAIVVVAHAIWGMARTLTPDARRRAIALAALLIVALSGSSFAQLAAIALGAVLGPVLCRNSAVPPADSLPPPLNRQAGTVLLALFAILLIGAIAFAGIADRSPPGLFALFYRCGALVFGGGHVVLPLLRTELVPNGLVSEGDFLAGYGAAQALPGPLFTLAAYLGAVAGGSALAAGAALLGIFAPGLLLVSGALPFWATLRTSLLSRSIVAGVNAAVVGILAWALYDPLWTTGIASVGDVALVAIGLTLLLRWRAPPILIVVLLAVGSILLGTAP
ncbi:chromate efflux transporter [Flavisphingomonas formosensis]|uniref:chromate efflux transporter n=1 Tax=Flavisphingomonas formosensis TaxID=861534 RepID=UPI0012F7EF4F|nr:chromate efflux transporter [Sphingomonas formosensis]